MKFSRLIIQHQIQPTNQSKKTPLKAPQKPQTNKNPIQTQKALKKLSLEFYHKVRAGIENNSSVFNPCKRKFC